MSEHAVFLLNAEGLITGCNAGAEAGSGYGAGEIFGQHVSRLYTDEDRKCGLPEQALDKALRAGTCEHTIWRVRKDGSRFMANVLTEPLRGGAGEVIGFAIIAIDAGDRAEAAHEFNNIIQVAGASIEGLRRCLPAGDPRASKLLEMLKRNVGLASEMMGRFLPSSGAEPGPLAEASDRPKALVGLRVLVVEDESLIAMHVEDLLSQLGCNVIALANDVAQALELVATADMDFALLDINLQGKPAYPVASALRERGIPFAFMSGDKRLEEQWANHPTIHKPFQLEEIGRKVHRALHAG